MIAVEAVKHFYEGPPRKDHSGVDLISDALPFGHLWYGEPNAVRNAIGYAMHSSRSHDAVIRVYDAPGKNERSTQAQRRFQRTMNSYSHFSVRFFLFAYPKSAFNNP